MNPQVSSAVSGRPEIEASARPSTRTHVFDAYGTLFDVHAPVMRHAGEIGPGATQVSEIWRGSNRWDVAGASASGIEAVWVNRREAPDEYEAYAPSAVIRSLSDVVIARISAPPSNPSSRAKEMRA